MSHKLKIHSSHLLLQNMKELPVPKLGARFGLFLLTLVLWVASDARATTVIAPDFDHLVSRADAIFEGNVTNIQSQWIGEGSEHRIVTFVTFTVDQSLKGDLGNTYTIRMLGGTVDGKTMSVTDAPKFAIGDHDLLFVENNGRQFIPLVGIQHGRFRIQKGEAGDDVLVTGEEQPLADVAQLGKDEPEIARNRRSLSLQQFKAAVQDRVREQKARRNTP
jgi:hypothetical protein